jgi:glutamine amidotransferase
MCRLAASFGATRPLSELLFDAPHGLESQAYRPRELVSGHVNVDGTGLAWWPAGDGARDPQRPLRYVTERPPWADANLAELGRLAADVQLAAVRSATPGMPFTPDAVGPFVRDDWAFAHNGYLEDFRATWQAPVLERLDRARLTDWTVSSDSLALLLWFDQHRESHPELPLAEHLAGWAADVLDLAAELGRAASLTCVVARRDGLWALRAAQGVPPNTLYRRPAAGDGSPHRLSSEPMDDGPWELVAPHRVVRASTSGWSHLDFDSPTPTAP